jgi:hypothetical protein
MEPVRFHKCSFAILAAGALACALFLNVAGTAAKQAAPAGVNLFQDVMTHQASLQWQNSPSANYPDDACGYLDACSADRSPAKYYALPVGTIDGRRIARAVYLVKVKDPKQPTAVVFEHQSASQTYFFRVAPDGSLMHVVYLDRSGTWLLVANSTGEPVFAKDAADWHAALAKPAAK